MVPFETIVAVVATLFVSIFGRDFLGRLLMSRQQQDAAEEATRQERESLVVAALVKLTQESSTAQIKLTEDALATLREFSIGQAQSLAELTSAVVRHEAAAEERLRDVTSAVQEMIKQVARLDADFQVRATEFGERFNTILEFATFLDTPDALRLLRELPGSEEKKTEQGE